MHASLVFGILRSLKAGVSYDIVESSKSMNDRRQNLMSSTKRP